jgi:GrpB-like predicted nucleotidyltransferase (UPF0157 family)
MPAPIAVELQPHDPAWAVAAMRESSKLLAVLGDRLVTVHHVGSTAVPGIRAKPILDLIPVFANAEALDESRPLFESIGYAWWGDYGLPGRRYCTLDDPDTGRRKVQLHGYLVGSAEIARHIAFRDFLRSRPDLARLYDAEKARCRDLHPFDSHAYTDCKCDVITRIQAAALSMKREDQP